MEQPQGWQTTTKSTVFRRRTLLSPVQSETKPSKYIYIYIYIYIFQLGTTVPVWCNEGYGHALQNKIV